MTEWADFDTPPSHCSACGYETDGAAAMTGTEGPEPGDLSVCLNCGEFLIFQEDMTLRRLTNEEFNQALGEDPEAISQMVVAAQIIAKRGPIR